MLADARTKEIEEISCPYDNEYQGRSSRYVFVCSAGLLRSPTAAKVATSLGYNARSCGSEEYALIPLSVNLIYWAYKIFFMNEEPYATAQNTFAFDSDILAQLNRKAVVWELDDIYNYNSPELVDKITKLLT